VVAVVEPDTHDLRRAFDRRRHSRTVLDDAGCRGKDECLRNRLRILSEAECYARIYYGARDETVKIVHLEPRRKRFQTRISGEQLRRHFEERLMKREPLARDEAK
jgi:hypothetical protein